MKLKSVDIDHYKNLDKKFSFEVSEKYIALIGLNGSGKSNLLEALSFLFAHLMGIDVEKFPFPKYIVKYTIRKHEVEVSENNSLKKDSFDEKITGAVFFQKNRAPISFENKYSVVKAQGACLLPVTIFILSLQMY